MEELLDLAEHEYRTLLEEGNWTGSLPDKPGSTFNTEICRETSTGETNQAEKYLPPWKRPPKDNEPDERMFKGKKEYWCARGCNWNRYHKTADHKTKKELARLKAEQQTKETTVMDASEVSSILTDPTNTGSANAAFLTNGFNI